MKVENEVVLLSVLQNRTVEETQRLEKLIAQSLDWGYIIGQLIHHRLTGYFIKFIPNDCHKYLFGEVERQCSLIFKLNQLITENTMHFVEKVFASFDEKNIPYAGLKGSVYNASMYPLGVRRSNDIDILVCEKDLKNADTVLREYGFKQSQHSKDAEASKREKLIQRMNHHDLVPYFKLNEDNLLIPYYKIDINFRMDSERENLEEKAFEFGTTYYQKNGFKIRGLRWEMHLLHLCIHFRREGSHSIWISQKRDCMLYKLVDIENTIRSIGKEKLEKWCDDMSGYNCSEDIYYTFYYLDQLYPSDVYKQIIASFDASEAEVVNKIKILGNSEVKCREKDFIESTFDLTYCIDFSKKEYQNIDIK